MLHHNILSDGLFITSFQIWRITLHIFIELFLRNDLIKFIQTLQAWCKLWYRSSTILQQFFNTSSTFISRFIQHIFNTSSTHLQHIFNTSMKQFFITTIIVTELHRILHHILHRILHHNNFITTYESQFMNNTFTKLSSQQFHHNLWITVYEQYFHNNFITTISSQLMNHSLWTIRQHIFTNFIARFISTLISYFI